MLGKALLLSLAGCVLSFNLTPPEDVNWVRENQRDVTLVCRASTKISSCSWTTPYGAQYPLDGKLKAEAGRLEHFANDEDVDCGIKITSIKATDHGEWQCNVAVVEDETEVKVMSASASINIANPEPPTSLVLLAPFNETTSNFTQGVVNKVSCSATGSRPAPSFLWTVEGETLTAPTEDLFDEENLTYSQILLFTPNVEDANKTLTCTVEHPGLTTEMSANTEIRLSFSSILTAQLGAGYITLIVLLALAGLIIIAAVLVAARMKMKGSQDLTPVDEEKGAEDSAKPETEDKEKTEEVDEKKNLNIQQKVVKILTALKPKEKKAADEVPALEFEKVDLNEVEETKPDENQPAAVEKVGFGEKISTFLSKLKPSPAEKKEKKEEAETETEKEAEPTEKVELDQEPKDESIQKRRGSETSV